MNKRIAWIRDNKAAQAVLLALYVLATAAGLSLAD